MNAEVRVATWNVMQGGNTEYRSLDTLPTVPESYSDIVKGIEVLRNQGFEIVSLNDTHGWSKQVSSDTLQSDTGYTFARTVLLEDKRLDSIDKVTSITLLSNLPLESIDILKIYNRNCIRVSVTKNNRLIDVYAIYLDDARERDRMEQVRALKEYIRGRNQPAIIMGDLNCTSKEDKNIFSSLFTFGLEFVPRYYLRNFGSFDTREDMYHLIIWLSKLCNFTLIKTQTLLEKYKNHGPIQYLEDIGFIDSSKLTNGSTMPTTKLFPIPFIDVDHILVSPSLSFMDTNVLKNKAFSVSDHYPRTAVVEL